MATPINSSQLAVLCAVRFIDPLTFTQIFPYINQFLSHLNVIRHPSHIGFYSGIVVSPFLIAPAIDTPLNLISRSPHLPFSSSAAYINGPVCLVWPTRISSAPIANSYTSDNIGRRPVVLIGSFGLAVSTIGLGLAPSLSFILLSRCLGVLFASFLTRIYSLPYLSWSIFRQCRRPALRPR
jgi:MFS family permease